jgi:hypothetical protein
MAVLAVATAIATTELTNTPLLESALQLVTDEPVVFVDVDWKDIDMPESSDPTLPRRSRRVSLPTGRSYYKLLRLLVQVQFCLCRCDFFLFGLKIQQCQEKQLFCV